MKDLLGNEIDLLDIVITAQDAKQSTIAVVTRLDLDRVQTNGSYMSRPEKLMVITKLLTNESVTEWQDKYKHLAVDTKITAKTHGVGLVAIHSQGRYYAVALVAENNLPGLMRSKDELVRRFKVPEHQILPVRVRERDIPAGSRMAPLWCTAAHWAMLRYHMLPTKWLVELGLICELKNGQILAEAPSAEGLVVAMNNWNNHQNIINLDHWLLTKEKAPWWI